MRTRNDKVYDAFLRWTELTPEEQSRVESMMRGYRHARAVENGTAPAPRKRRERLKKSQEAAAL